MRTTTKIVGSDKIRKALLKASNSLTRKVLLSGMRKAATPLVKAMRANIKPSGRDYSNAKYDRSSGDLKKSIGKITGRSKKFPSIYVGPRVKRKWGNKGFVGHWVEFGNDTGYNLNFDGKRYVSKAYESKANEVENILEQEILKAAMKFLK